MKELFVKFLTSLYQNTCTALQSIEDIMPKIEDEDLKKELSNQYSTYDVISKECEMLGKSEDIDLKDNNWFEKLKLWGAINMGTVGDKSTRHMAEMLLQGTVMGLVQCLKDAKDYKSVSQDLDDICEKLTNFEEDCYQRLKNFI